MVLEDGTDKEELETLKKPMAILSHPYTTVFTPGIWVRYDRQVLKAISIMFVDHDP